MAAPEAYAKHLAEHGYHPRSDKHSNALAEFVLNDLLEHCPRIAEHAERGDVVWDLNMKIKKGTVDWNIDLVVGAPPPPIMPPDVGQAIRRATPSTIRIAVELKGVMTEHGKARRNRVRDFEAFHMHVHGYDPDAVAGGLVVFNIASRFKSPLRVSEPGPIEHKNVVTLVKEGIDLFLGLPMRATGPGDGLEAVGVFVVDYDNLPGSPARVHSRPPAPQTGSPVEYQTFIQRICQRYMQRWA